MTKKPNTVRTLNFLTLWRMHALCWMFEVLKANSALSYSTFVSVSGRHALGTPVKNSGCTHPIHPIHPCIHNHSQSFTIIHAIYGSTIAFACTVAFFSYAQAHRLPIVCLHVSMKPPDHSIPTILLHCIRNF